MSAGDAGEQGALRPLADRMRPRTLEEFVGQRHLLGPGKPLSTAIRSGQLHSLIFWGPPGTGKTTLAARAADGRATLLFLDEVHRFNKAQQDTFLPYLEDGTLTFVGATTENPSFEVVSALLSRARVYVLRPLSLEDLTLLLHSALTDAERGLGSEHLEAEPDALDLLARAADGDARR